MSALEELILVTDFGSPRAGDLVVVVRCRWCARTHRGMLTRYVSSRPVLEPDGSVIIGQGWQRVPRGGCVKRDHSNSIEIGQVTVTERRLYRVVIPGIADEQTTSASRPTTRTRSANRSPRRSIVKMARQREKGDVR